MTAHAEYFKFSVRIWNTTFKKIQFQMKHFHLSANKSVFLHSGEQCDFFRSHSKQVWRQSPKPCTAQWWCPALLLKECLWIGWGSSWLHRQCFGKSNISCGIGRFRTQTWRNDFHCANRMKWKPRAFSLLTMSVQLHGLLQEMSGNLKVEKTHKIT